MSTAPMLADALRLRRSGAVYNGACPSCGYKGGFSAQDRNGRTLVRCHVGCTQTDVIEALRRAGLWAGASDRNREPLPQRGEARGGRSERPAPEIAAAVDRLWRASLSLPGTLAEKYLRARGLTIAAPSDLRFCPLLRHRPTGTDWPAMLAGVRNAAGELVGLHRTYLRRDGAGKAPLDLAKMSLGIVGGAAAQLGAPADRLVVGEGIESTLSAMAGAGLPGWAALSAGGIRALVLPPLPRAATVIIAADRDPVGIAAAHDAAARWDAEGRGVHIASPPPGFDDWNDAIRAEVSDAR